MKKITVPFVVAVIAVAGAVFLIKKRKTKALAETEE